MYIKNIYASTVYKGVFVVLCAAALIMDFGFFRGGAKWHILNYYTILSNIVCLVFFSAAFVACAGAWARGDRAYAYAPRAEGAVVLCIAVTGLIYHFMLAPGSLDTAGGGSFAFPNLMLHYLGPAMVLLDWLLFSPKGRFCKLDPLKWLLIPLGYFIYILVRSAFAGNIGGSGSKFPYAFMDPAVQDGWGNMLLGVLEVATGMAALGYVIYIADWLMAKRSKRKTAL